jgi:(S)-2-hydroxyglutarate dehydrogenase
VQRVDIAVVGGGVVGLAVARELLFRFPRLRLAVLEKEDDVGRHQSGHNSGVIHSGLYYKPGSLKARLCVEGAEAMVAFCRQEGIAHEVCGKVVVATSPDEATRLEALQQRGEANGLKGLKRVGPSELRELEPHAAGIAALHVPSTGITDYAVVCRRYAEHIRHAGGEVRTGNELRSVVQQSSESVLETTSGKLTTRFAVSCAGLFSDRVSRMAGHTPEIKIVPFRGEYYDLAPARQGLVKHLIYPVPDPRFPFLGVHFTRRITGTVDAGPNAVLALRREGYRARDFSWGDTWDCLCYPGFWRMGMRMLAPGLAEQYRSWNKAAFVRSLQRLLPEIREQDLVPGGSGVRAQALKRDGTLVDDFAFTFSSNWLHVYNVPSPAATASLAIARVLADEVQRRFGLSA